MIEVAGNRFETEEDFQAEIFKVDAKSGQRIPYRMNSVQRYFDSEIKRLGAQMVLVVKPRQVGISEYILKRTFYKLLTEYPLKAAVLSHEAEATQRLLDRVRMTYNNLPEWFKPPIFHNSDNEMSWPSIGSSIYVGTAGAKSFGRGDTFHLVHMSEYAHWSVSQAANIRLGLQESRPKGGTIIIECTPNGEGNEFHQLYLAAKSGESPYKAIFIPWMMAKDEYFLLPGDSTALESSKGVFEPTVYEKWLMETYQLSLSNIRWRRSKIAGFTARPDVGNNLSLAELFFKQEYPEDDVSCFVSLSRTLFDNQQLIALRRDAKPPKFVDEEGIEWWNFPLEGRIYVVACDPATVWGRDSAVILGLDVTDYPRVLHVATWAGKVSDDKLAGLIKKMAQRLNNAYTIVEFNNSGQAVLAHLITTQRYSNLFYQIDVLNAQIPQRPGWLTTKPSKRVLIQEGLRVINGGYLITYDARLAKELQYFRHNQEEDTYEAAPGQHDDFVMAVLLGFQAANYAPRSLVHGKKSHPYGWDW